MNKEQFKISVLNLINYYTSELICLNIQAAEKGGDPGIMTMLNTQAAALDKSFSFSLNELIDNVWVEETPQEGIEE